MNKLKPRGKQVLIEGTTEAKTSSGIIIAGQDPENIERKRYVKTTKVLAVGEDVHDLKEGDEVVLTDDSLMKLSNNIARWLLNKKEQEELKNKKDKFYIMVPEDQVRAIICKE